MDEQERIVLAFDLGTQSSRALLVNNFGEILAKKKIAHEPAYVSSQADWAEQEADFYYNRICEASKYLSIHEKALFDRAEAVSITTIRDTVVCVDMDGIPLRPAILWLDKRKAEGNCSLSQISKTVFKATGMEDAANLQYQNSHCNWIAQNEPEIWKKTHKYLLLSGYLIYKLTGQMKDATASLVGHIPFDSKNRTWQKENALTRPVFNVPASKLCEIVESAKIIGTITAQASVDSGLKQGLPLYASGSDKACEVIGLGGLSKEKAVIAFGTTSTITFTIDRYLEPERFIPPYASIIPNRFTPEIEIYRGYWLISWFKKEFAAKEVLQAESLGVSAEELLNQRLKEIPAGCDGLFFQPYFTPNMTMPVARGAIIGYTDIHTRIHLYRAIIEGINFALMSGMRLMEKRAGHEFEEILLGGGGSQSDEICQITADMFGIPAVRTQTYEVAGIGCAICAFVGLGAFKTYEEAVDKMVHRRDVFYPNMKEHKIYDELYREIFANIYGRLSPLYYKLHQIYNR